MKNSILAICLIIISPILIGIGYSLGHSSKVKDIMIADHIVTGELIAASQNILLLEMLSEGKVDKAICTINSSLDTQIAMVNNLLPKDKNLQSRIIANNIFLRVAKYRKEFTREKTEYNHNSDIGEYLDQLLKTSSM